MKKILSVVLIMILMLSFVACGEGKVERDYNKAVALMEEGKYAEAITKFEALDGYKNSEKRIAECENAIKYNDAMALINAEKYIEAYKILTALGNYKDSSEKANSIYKNYRSEQIKEAKIGDYVFFGEYDNHTSTGKEEIEWLVLDIKDNKALVISKLWLDAKPYNTTDTDTTWETCSLRKWLNDDFFNTAFSDSEKEKIPTVTVSADKNPRYDTEIGNATQDRVFLLSYIEVEKYIIKDDVTLTGPMPMWLRTPGSKQNNACIYPSFSGVNMVSDCTVSSEFLDIHPAMWIELS